ncbi:hypothetical protein GW17_00055196, partial [Ensete ventricosum]
LSRTTCSHTVLALVKKIASGVGFRSLSRVQPWSRRVAPPSPVLFPSLAPPPPPHQQVLLQLIPSSSWPSFDYSCYRSFDTEKETSKLRDDWRKRSKPIRPGGVYPAKDHCRIQIYFIILSLGAQWTGIVTTIAVEMLKANMVDAVICVQSCFDYTNALADLVVGYMGVPNFHDRNERGREMLKLVEKLLEITPTTSSGKVLSQLPNSLEIS